MTGKELIWFIQTNHAEDYDIISYDDDENDYDIHHIYINHNGEMIYIGQGALS